MLTQKELKELLHYNPDTGVFTWRVSPSRTVKVGQVAGHTPKNTGYLQIRLSNKLYQGHRLAWLYMAGEWPRKYIDHINGVRDDNRWVNLREATQRQNAYNRGGMKGSSSNHKGVSWDKWNKKWVVKARSPTKHLNLGYFDCEHEAALVYNQFALKHHGEYALFNQVYNHFDVEVGRGD